MAEAGNNWKKTIGLRAAVAATLIAACVGGFFYLSSQNQGGDSGPPRQPGSEPRTVADREYKIWWGKLPEEAQPATSSEQSNIRRDDYVGVATCAKCHKKQHAEWSEHPHRWMNAAANKESIRGDFSDVVMKYRSGTVRFYQHAGEYRMELRGRTNRLYVVEQTIGSRYFQFYVGRLVSGPEPLGAKNYTVRHVLPMGYELERKRWIPATNVGWNASRFGDVVDPFLFSRVPAYHPRCITCHTTISWGDWALKTSVDGDFPERLKNLSKLSKTSFHASQFLADAYPHRFREPPTKELTQPSANENAFIGRLQRMDSKDLSLTLGISCEACHLGGKEHSLNPKRYPMRFAPSGPSVLHYDKTNEATFRRSRSNINLICGRCHNNTAKTYSAGMATYNSVEHADAVTGSCYSKLSCVHCHDPHRATGPRWSMTQEAENALCTKCHPKLRTNEGLTAHTHHAPDSAASRCMNCHMPHITEGIAGMVRTHAIFSPTNEKMLKSNHPNACNLCHLDKSKRWTMNHLSDWYKKSFSEDLLEAKDADRPSGELWLDGDHVWTRMSAAHAASKQNARYLLPKLFPLLKDDYVVGRHFLEIDLENMLKIKLDDYGYQFYQSKSERQRSVPKLIRQLRD